MPDPAERPPIAASPLSLILVAHNAAAEVEAVVKAWAVQLDALSRPYEILLVDDGSNDDTPVLTDLLADQSKRVKALHHASPQGFGAALRSGLAAAKHPLLAYCTCDRQYQPGELKRFLEMIDKVDLVTGYRQWLPVPRLLKVLGTVWRGLVRVLFGIPLEPLPCWLGDRGQQKRWLARWFFGVRVHDVECAFRLFRRSVFTRIPIQSNGPFAQVEILAKANFTGCWMAEVPVSYNPPPAGPPIAPAPKPTDSYITEARRLFSDPDFGPVDPSARPAPAAEKPETPAAPAV